MCDILRSFVHTWYDVLCSHWCHQCPLLSCRAWSRHRMHFQVSENISVLTRFTHWQCHIALLICRLMTALAIWSLSSCLKLVRIIGSHWALLVSIDNGGKRYTGTTTLIVNYTTTVIYNSHDYNIMKCARFLLDVAVLRVFTEINIAQVPMGTSVVFAQ